MENDLHGKINIRLNTENKDLQGKLFTRPRFNNDIDGSIYIIDWYDLHELNGTLNIRNYTDSNELSGTMYIPKERSSNLNGTLESPQMKNMQIFKVLYL